MAGCTIKQIGMARRPFTDLVFLLLVPLVSLVQWTAALNSTVDNGKLKTWWHNTGEINTHTPVQDGNVRQSHMYSIQIGSEQTGPFYDSFTYETIPRNGQGDILIPGDPSSTTNNNDGVTIEPDVNITMAWSSFLYSDDVWVKITRFNFSSAANASSIIIRPTNLGYTVTTLGDDILIHVPYNSDSHGTRFSVEFQDDLYEYHDSCGAGGCGYVQDSNPSGYSYISSYSSKNPIMSVEPQNALLIFASPFLDSSLVPDVNASSSYILYPGYVSDLSSITASTIVFTPGVYYFTGTSHANLSSSVNWVYFEAGAYVKGAVQFSTSNPTVKATGHGVLSGEQYVYQANPSQGYTNAGSNTCSLRMWSGISSSDVNQTLYLAGPTINSPPFNSMDFVGDVSSMNVQAWDYKQVGAFFGQTDGLENYPGSWIRDVFYHSNDDTIKTYYSNVVVERVIVWKATTAPTIQFGWAPRNLTNVTVDNIDIIHSRYSSNGSHPSVIGANQIYGVSESNTSTADLSCTISDVTFSNIRSEGISGNLFRIVPLTNIDNLVIQNVDIDAFSVLSDGIQASQLPFWTDAQGRRPSVSGFSVRDYSVNGTSISRSNLPVGGLGGLVSWLGLGRGRGGVPGGDAEGEGEGNNFSIV